MNQTKRDLLRKVGDLSQLAGIRQMSFSSGKAKGTPALELYNLAGLRCTVLPDQCMNLFDMQYKGVNLGFISKNGLAGSPYINALGDEFLYQWPAGMLYTCGLSNTGPSNEDHGRFQTEHGRIGFAPAEYIAINEDWENDSYVIKLKGSMRETMIYGLNLKLTREISLGLHDKHILIEDTLENLEPKEEEFMLLYHFNFGYPLVDDGAEILTSAGEVSPRTENSKKGLKNWNKIESPEDGAEEEVFFHKNPPNTKVAEAAIINSTLGLGVKLRYSADTLPILVQWKSMRSHDYVIGVEPSNSFIMGRNEERKNGTLKKIGGFEKIHYKLELMVIDGESEIQEVRNQLGNGYVLIS